jgi:sulfate permease, SulP family
MRIKQNTYNQIAVGIVSSIRTILGSLALSSILAGASHVNIQSIFSIVILSSAISAIFFGLFSSIKESVSQPQDGPAIVFVTLLSQLYKINGSLQPSEVISTIAVISLIVGICFVLIGYFKVGNIIRVMPYPVIGGFLAGSGLIILANFCSKIIAIISSFKEAFYPIQCFPPLIAIFFSISVILLNNRYRNPFILPLMVIVFSISTHFWLFYSGLDNTHAIAIGVLPNLSSINASNMIHVNFTVFDVRYFENRWYEILSVVIVSVVSLLLILSSLELRLHREININKEIVLAGFVNMINASFGGIVNFTSLSASYSVIDKAPDSRLPALIVGVGSLLVFFLGVSFLSLIPVPIISGILLMIGFSFCYEWIILGYKRLSKFDYSAILLISISILLFGFVVGVVLGILISFIAFILQYSRLKIIRHQLSGAVLKSNVERTTYQKLILKKHQDSIVLLKIDGFLFFGSIHSLFSKILTISKSTEIRYLLLDMSLVPSVDLAAVETFNRIKLVCSSSNIKLLLIGVESSVAKSLTKLNSDLSITDFYFSLDSAVEYCEEAIIAQEAVEAGIEINSHQNDLRTIFCKYRMIQLKKGEKLFSVGDASFDLFFLISGKVSIFIQQFSGDKVRVQAVTPFVLFGERSFISTSAHASEAIADEDCELYAISRVDYDQLQVRSPGEFRILNNYIFESLAGRLLHADNLIAVLTDT